MSSLVSTILTLAFSFRSAEVGPVAHSIEHHTQHLRIVWNIQNGKKAGLTLSHHGNDWGDETMLARMVPDELPPQWSVGEGDTLTPGRKMARKGRWMSKFCFFLSIVFRCNVLIDSCRSLCGSPSRRAIYDAQLGSNGQR